MVFRSNSAIALRGSSGSFSKALLSMGSHEICGKVTARNLVAVETTSKLSIPNGKFASMADDGEGR